MPTFDEAVAQLRGPEAAGFGVSEAQAGRLINQGVREYASRSEWIRAQLNLGPTVAGQAEYPLPANVVKVKRLRVGESARYTRQDLETLWDLQAGLLRVQSGYGGIYVATFDDDGSDRSITLWPTPELPDLQPITALAAIFPANPLSGSDPIPFPDDHWRGVLSGAKAIAYEDVDENPTQASYFRGLFDREAEELRRKANSRVGGGPVKFPVAGH